VITRQGSATVKQATPGVHRVDGWGWAYVWLATWLAAIQPKYRIGPIATLLTFGYLSH